MFNRQMNHRSIIVWAGLVTFGAAIFLSPSAVAGSKGTAFKINAPVKAPDLIAVQFHHDMCPYCKKLSPEFSKLAREATDDSVLFLTLDLTTKASQRQAALLVGSLGLEKLWTGDLSRIGSVSFVEGESKQVVATFRADEHKSLGDTLRDAIAARRRH